jgi:hypothetical protein
MGAFYAATLGMGGYLAGWTGTFTQRLGNGQFFFTLASGTLVAAFIAILVGPSLRRMAASSGVALSAPAA